MVHLRHAIDGYPLCWPMSRAGRFDGSLQDEDVTCPECLAILREDDET